MSSLVGRAFGRYSVVTSLGEHEGIERYRLADGWLLERFRGVAEPGPGVWRAWRDRFGDLDLDEGPFDFALIADVVADGEDALVVYAQSERPEPLDLEALGRLALTLAAAHRKDLFHGALRQGISLGRAIIGMRPPGVVVADASDDTRALARVANELQPDARLAALTTAGEVGMSELVIALVALTGFADYQLAGQCERCGFQLIETTAYAIHETRPRATATWETTIECPQCGARDYRSAPA